MRITGSAVCHMARFGIVRCVDQDGFRHEERRKKRFVGPSRDGRDGYRGIDFGKRQFGAFRFIHSETGRGVQRLTRQVRFFHCVGVDDGDGTRAGLNEREKRRRTDAARADHHERSAGESSLSFGPPFL